MEAHLPVLLRLSGAAGRIDPHLHTAISLLGQLLGGAFFGGRKLPGIAEPSLDCK
jgi:hypothetical protein